MTLEGRGLPRDRQQCVIYPFSPFEFGKENEITISFPDQFDFNPVEATSIQSNYTSTVPKVFFSGYEGKSKWGRSQEPLFSRGDDVFFVKSDVLWRAGKSFYMLDEESYQILLNDLGSDDGFMHDGGRNPRMNKTQRLVDGEVLYLEEDRIIEVDSAIDRLDELAFKIKNDDHLSDQGYRTHMLTIGEDGEVISDSRLF